MNGSGDASAGGAEVTRVLIADDHPTVHAGLATLIHTEKPDWEICPAASDGREAIARATELRPHLVIMDYSMPHLNGLEAAGEIHRTLTGIEVLIFTGTQCRHALGEAFHSQARGCLLKSEGADTLLRALQSVRHHDRFRSHGITAVCDEIARTNGKLGTLTDREREVARLIAEGKSTKMIAGALGISDKTIETHRANVFAKLKVHTVAELVRYALRIGLVQL